MALQHDFNDLRGLLEQLVAHPEQVNEVIATYKKWQRFYILLDDGYNVRFPEYSDNTPRPDFIDVQTEIYPLTDEQFVEWKKTHKGSIG